MENSFSKSLDEKAWMDEFSKEHSTLQQNEVRLFVKMLEHLSELSEFDDRRKASIRLAKRVIQIMKDEDIALPYIWYAIHLKAEQSKKDLLVIERIFFAVPICKIKWRTFQDFSRFVRHLAALEDSQKHNHVFATAKKT